jgi:hypothetical protein
METIPNSSTEAFAIPIGAAQRSRASPSKTKALPLAGTLHPTRRFLFFPLTRAERMAKRTSPVLRVIVAKKNGWQCNQRQRLSYFFGKTNNGTFEAKATSTELLDKNSLSSQLFF